MGYFSISNSAFLTASVGYMTIVFLTFFLLTFTIMIMNDFKVTLTFLHVTFLLFYLEPKSTRMASEF